MFKGLNVDRFLIKDPGPVPLDDIVRALVAGPTDAVALRYMGIAEVNGESFRAIFCAAEAGGRRHDRVLALNVSPQGQLLGLHAELHQAHGPVGPEGCWSSRWPAREISGTSRRPSRWACVTSRRACAAAPSWPSWAT